MAAEPPAPADTAWADPGGLRLVGDPVDVVTGRVTERILCFRLIGPLTLNWHRLYDSARTAAIRGFGPGHAHAFDDRLTFDADGLVLEDAAGARTAFPALREDGASATVRGKTLRRAGLLAYLLFRPGQPAASFTFFDPERPARIARLARGKAAIGFRYDARGRLTGLVHSNGLAITAEEDASGRLLWLAGAWDGGSENRPILSCAYNESGDCTAMEDGLGRRFAFTYDSAHRLTRRTDRRGYSFLFQYDSQGRCVAAAGEDGVMGVRLAYDPANRKTQVQRSDGGLWTYHYDDSGTITQIISPENTVRRFIKGPGGRITGEIDALGEALEWVLAPGGGLAAKKFSTGRVIPVVAGEDIAAPPPHIVADRASEYYFGGLAAALPETDALRDLPQSTRQHLAPWHPPVPDTPHVPQFGVLPWYPEPSGGRAYSPFGHLIAQELPGGATRSWSYDPNDSMYTQTDADGCTTRQERRSWNQLATWVDPLGNATQYRFRSEDQVTGIRDPGGTLTEFAYDKMRRLTGVRRGGYLRDVYRYDAAGNLIEKRDANGDTLLTFTPTTDRLIAERRLASGGVHRFDYDKAGRFTRARVDFSAVVFAYDDLGRRVQDERDGRGVIHDAKGTAVLGHKIGRAQDERGLTLALPGGGSIRIERLAQGVIRRVFSNGTTELCQFDVMGRCLASVAAFKDGAGWRRRWRYSAEGDLLEAEDSRHGGHTYGYDAAHRLVSATGPRGPAEIFTHDDAGNLTAQPGLAGVTLADANRLATANAEIFIYDSRHHMARRETQSGPTDYTYDSRDMLVRVDSPAGIFRAEYDALGRRTKSWDGEREQTYFWDTDRLAAEIFPSGMLRIYVYADHGALTPLAFIDYPGADSPPEDGAARFILADQRGAPVLVQDAAGATLWEARLAPYGAAKIKSAGLELNLRFPGHYFDVATGLHYNRFRYYDPVLGRYLQSDPIGVGGGINVYAYPANPLVTVDVRGLTAGSGGNCPDDPAGCQNEDLNQEATAPVEKESTITANAAAGKAFEKVGLAYLDGEQDDVEDQVSIRPYLDDGTLAGYRVRLDALGRDDDGNVALTDFKSSDTAGLTKNQTTGYPLIAKNGGQVVGDNGGTSYPRGTQIPPTPVSIITPKDIPKGT